MYLLAISLSICIPIASFLFCLAEVLYYKDPLCFFRKRNLRKKLKKTNHSSLEDYLETLLEDAKWQLLNNEEMILYPFSNENTKFVFTRNEKESRLLLFEKNMGLFDLHQYMDSKTVYFQNNFDKSSKNDSISMRHEGILEHLNTVLEKLKTENKQVGKTKEEQAHENKQFFLKNEQKQLQEILQSDILWKNKNADSFHIKTFKSKNHHYVSLLFKNTPLFNCSWKNETFHYEFLNEHSDVFSIIQGCEEEIVSYFHQKIASKKQKTESIHDSDNVIKKKENIEQKLHYLEKNLSYLSEENIHKVLHTYPNDLKKVIEIYHSLQNTSAAESEVLSALHVMFQSLLEMEREIENNKHKHLLLQTEIIKVRD